MTEASRRRQRSRRLSPRWSEAGAFSQGSQFGEKGPVCRWRLAGGDSRNPHGKGTDRRASGKAVKLDSDPRSLGRGCWEDGHRWGGTEKRALGSSLRSTRRQGWRAPGSSCAPQCAVPAAGPCTRLPVGSRPRSASSPEQGGTDAAAGEPKPTCAGHRAAVPCPQRAGVIATLLSCPRACERFICARIPDSSVSRRQGEAAGGRGRQGELQVLPSCWGAQFPCGHSRMHMSLRVRPRCPCRGPGCPCLEGPLPLRFLPLLRPGKSVPCCFRTAFSSEPRVGPWPPSEGSCVRCGGRWGVVRRAALGRGFGCQSVPCSPQACGGRPSAPGLCVGWRGRCWRFGMFVSQPVPRVLVLPPQGAQERTRQVRGGEGAARTEGRSWPQVRSLDRSS